MSFGPILHIKEMTLLGWHMSILIGSNEPNKVSVHIDESNTDIESENIYQNGDINFYVYPFYLPLDDEEKVITYSVDDNVYQFVLPSSQDDPHIVAASCNGFDSADQEAADNDPTIMWRRLQQEHNKRHYHLMILCGDQIYGDEAITKAVPELNGWTPLLATEKRLAIVDTIDFASLKQGLLRNYHNQYVKMFTDIDRRNLFATLPSIMTWDDHEIIDGYGSYLFDDEVMRTLFSTAYELYCAYQLQKIPSTPVTSYQSFRTPSIKILLMDSRTEKSFYGRKQVMSVETWNVFYKDLLESYQDENVKSIYIVVATPFIYHNVSFGLKVLNFIPGYQDLEDDLRDVWISNPRRLEYEELLDRLNEYGEAYGKRKVMFIAGDVHVASHGTVKVGDSKFYQVTTSPIVNVPVNTISSIGIRLMNYLSPWKNKTPAGIKYHHKMLTLGGSSILNEKNWLHIVDDEVRWFTADKSYSKSIYENTY